MEGGDGGKAGSARTLRSEGFGRDGGSGVEAETESPHWRQGSCGLCFTTFTHQRNVQTGLKWLVDRAYIGRRLLPVVRSGDEFTDFRHQGLGCPRSWCTDL